MNSFEPVRTDEPQTNPTQTQKKLYTAPRVTVHGTVAELTLAAKIGNTPDIGGPGVSFIGPQ